MKYDTKKKKVVNKIIDMTEKDAKNYLEKNDMIMRVMRRESEALFVSQEMKLNRINVSVEDDKVVGILKIG